MFVLAKKVYDVDYFLPIILFHRAVAEFLSSFRSKELIFLLMDCSFEAREWLGKQFLLTY